MGVVARLLTVVDIADRDDDGPDARRMSVSARHEAVLADGRRVVLLDGRGWSGEIRGAGGAEPGGVWAYETAAEMERTARDVVGPDEPFEGHTEADMHVSHWDHLAGILREQGVEAEPAELMGLPHDVELSDRVRARVGVGGGRR